jgi:hypothetical protein
MCPEYRIFPQGFRLKAASPTNQPTPAPERWQKTLSGFELPEWAQRENHIIFCIMQVKIIWLR